MYQDKRSYLPNHQDDNVVPNLNDPVIARKLVLAKVFIGFADFTEQEERTLRAFFATLKTKANAENIKEGLLLHAYKFGSVKQQNVLKRLWNAAN